jgi:hypothetical protein
MSGVIPGGAIAQTPAAPVMQDRIQLLTEAIDRVEAQLQQSQRELAGLKEQLQALRGVSGEIPQPSEQPAGAAELAEAVAHIRESQAMQESQISTLAQSKVETASKYPLKLSGMILMTGFVNTQRVDSAQFPAVALAGSGSTGATLQNTVLGIDATGPDLIGASSRADLRIDFAGAAAAGTSGYASPLVRLRTAHADLTWNRTKAYFALDKTTLNPDSPTSIAAVALPPLAWSGNLWTWNPQFGGARDLLPIHSGAIRFKAALSDVADPPPLFTPSAPGTYVPPSSGELSRWPGIEGRLAYETDDAERGTRFGVSGYFATHRTSSNSTKYESWATAADVRFSFLRFSQISGNAYYGAGLGGLGGGTYKNSVLRIVSGEQYFRVLDDMGGWLQWKERAGERLEFNEAFGIDNVPAGQLRPFAITTPISYYNLARNRTFTGNVIYSPSAYLLFSLEYRRIASSYVTAPTQSSNVVDIVAGYRF